MNYLPVNKARALKVLDAVDAGLCSGIGSGKPGDMCVEAAVCYAFDEPNTDEPKCVMSLIRDMKIEINDNGVWGL